MSLASTLATNRSARPTQYIPEDYFDDDALRDRLLVVETGSYRFAIPVTFVRGVQRAARTTRVPGAPAVLHGLANLRGSVVTVLDLEVALEAPFASTAEWPLPTREFAAVSLRGGEGGSIVLLEHGTGLVGLRVDAVHAVTARDDGPVAPATLAWCLVPGVSAHAPLTGIARLGGDEVPLLDVPALFMRYLITSTE